VVSRGLTKTGKKKKRRGGKKKGGGTKGVDARKGGVFHEVEGKREIREQEVKILSMGFQLQGEGE